jgi:hypothetical protein
VREQTAHPNCGSRRRPGISSNACTQIGEQPFLGASSRKDCHKDCLKLQYFFEDQEKQTNNHYQADDEHRLTEYVRIHEVCGMNVVSVSHFLPLP